MFKQLEPGKLEGNHPNLFLYNQTTSDFTLNIAFGQGIEMYLSNGSRIWPGWQLWSAWKMVIWASEYNLGPQKWGVGACEKLNV